MQSDVGRQTDNDYDVRLTMSQSSSYAFPVAALLGADKRVANQVHVAHPKYSRSGCGSIELSRLAGPVSWRWGLRFASISDQVSSITFALGMLDNRCLNTDLTMELCHRGQVVARSMYAAGKLAAFGGVLLLHIYRHRSTWKVRSDLAGFHVTATNNGLTGLLEHLGINSVVLQN